MKVPKSVTPEVFKDICHEITMGSTIRAYCKEPGTPDMRDVYKAIAADPEYYQQYLRAREAQMVFWEEEIIEIAGDSSLDKKEDGRYDHEHIQRSKLRVDTLKWILSKRLPKLYGERAIREIVGADGGAIQTSSTIDLSKLTDEELAILEKVQS